MIVDILVLAVLLISALIAFLRGFIREVLTITGVIGGLAAAYFGGPLLIPHMRGWFGVEDGIEPERLFGIIPYDVLADALSYGAIFIVVVIILSVLSHYLAETARSIGLGAVDRSLGFVFGLIRGILILGLLYLPVHLFIDNDAKDDWFNNSKTHFYLEKVAEALEGFIPESAIEDAETEIDRAKEGADNASSARETLEKIELLRKDGEPIRPQGGQTSPDGTSPDGYSEEFREQMDQLFDEKTEDSLNR